MCVEGDADERRNLNPVFNHFNLPGAEVSVSWNQFGSWLIVVDFSVYVADADHLSTLKLLAFQPHPLS